MEQSVNLVCSRCSAVVRVPRERLEHSPRCPTCHTPILDGLPLELTSASFERHIARTSLPVLVDFWAPWCAPCRAMAPHFTQVAQQFASQVRFAKLDTEAEPLPATRFAIRSIPTLILFKGGSERVRHSGAMGADQLAGWLSAHLGEGVNLRRSG